MALSKENKYEQINTRVWARQLLGVAGIRQRLPSLDNAKQIGKTSLTFSLSYKDPCLHSLSSATENCSDGLAPQPGNIVRSALHFCCFEPQGFVSVILDIPQKRHVKI